jgi:UDP-N-acetylmuramate--alanine ligase
MKDESPRLVHFIGIGGSGMRPLAEIALAQGYQVSGSDQNQSSSTDELVARGARVTIGHLAEAIPQGPVRIVASTAIKGANPEVAEAQRLGLPILHRSEFLHELMSRFKPICISGTHGKTSTTAMVAFMLRELGLDPTAAIGGELVGTSSYSMSGSGPWFVAECDESDGSFLRYEPYLSIVTNIDLDHLDYYQDLEGLKRGFLTFVNKTHPDGWAIFGWDNNAARDVAHEFTGQRLTFGTRIGSEVRGLNFKSHGAVADYQAVVDKILIKGSAPLVGRHNLQNILCCLAVAKALDLDLQKAADALARYPGVKRRFSLVADIDGVKIFDDYAHNPGKIQSCIEGAREAFPNERLIVIFQPHRYSRLETMYNELMASFAAADEVLILPVYAAGESTDKDFSPSILAEDLSRVSRVKAQPYSTDTLNKLLQSPRRPTVLITVGAGDVSQLSQEWKDALHEQKTAQERTPR